MNKFAGKSKNQRMIQIINCFKNFKRKPTVRFAAVYPSTFD